MACRILVDQVLLAPGPKAARKVSGLRVTHGLIITSAGTLLPGGVPPRSPRDNIEPMRNRGLGGVVLFGIVSLAHAPGCSHETSPVHDARADAVASAAERLQGRWVLVSFQPELALEPTLQVLLNMQIGRLVAEFRGSKVSAQGPGVQVERAFRVQEAYGDHFKATVYDAYGVGVDSSNDFSSDLLVVNGITSPWRGRAVFRRVP